MKSTLYFPGDGAGSIRQIGGKAFHLDTMKRRGFPVPSFFVIPAAMVDEILQTVGNDVEQMAAGFDFSKEKERRLLCERIRYKIAATPIPGKCLAELIANCEAMCGENWRVSVRSSAIAEDGAKTSFAGQHSSFLFVDTVGLAPAMMGVIASAWSFGALTYRTLHGIPLQHIKIAVVIQQMVDAATSGVGFSMNLAGNLADRLLVAGYGLGEGIVTDQVETDSFAVCRQAKSIDRKITRKCSRLVFSPESGLHKKSVETDLADKPVLTDKQVLEVTGFIEKAEQLLGIPADIEFSYDKTGAIFVLQMRPITSVDRDKIKILDLTNIVESYPGITLPLTFNFVKEAYRRVFTGSAGAFMVSDSVVARYSPVFENLVAHCNGRIYYRLDNWYRMLALVHHSRKSMAAWEQAVGLSRDAGETFQFSARGKFRALIASANLLIRYTKGNDAFFRQFQKNYRLLRNYSHCQSPLDLWNHYETVANLLFKPWYHTIVNDFIAFKAFGWLREMVEKYKIGDAGLANDLLCGIGGVASEEAIIKVLKFKEKIQNDPGLSRIFTLPDSEVLQVLKTEHSQLYQEIVDYLEEYGDRTLAELKLESKSFRRNPDLFVGMLRAQLLSPGTAAEFGHKQSIIREEATAKVRERLKWPVTVLFSGVLSLARYGLKNRENMRFCRTRGYGAVKDLFLEIGKMMAAALVIDAPEHVFYLDVADLRAFCVDDNRESLAVKVKAIQQDYKGYESLNMPANIMYIDEPPEFTSQQIDPVIGAACLQGIPVSKGVVQAEAIVVREPDFDMPVRGKILVTKMTDPGWIFLMAQAAGLVSEKGSLLSHTAIVGRELGIPVIVGAAGATSIYKNGDVLRLDGNKGTVGRV